MRPHASRVSFGRKTTARPTSWSRRTRGSSRDRLGPRWPGELVEIATGARDGGDRGAFLSQRERSGPTDPAARAGDEHRLCSTAASMVPSSDSRRLGRVLEGAEKFSGSRVTFKRRQAVKDNLMREHYSRLTATQWSVMLHATAHSAS